MKKRQWLNIDPQQSFDYAKLWKRMIAYFIDWYMISVLTIFPIQLIDSITYQKINQENTLMNLPVPQAILAFGLGLLLSFLYLIYLPYRYHGMTLGKRLLHIRIIQSNQKPLILKTLLIRNGLGILILEGSLYTSSIYFWELINLISHSHFSSWILNICNIIVISSLAMSLFPGHRMLHDYLSHTLVVNAEK